MAKKRIAAKKSAAPKSKAPQKKSGGDKPKTQVRRHTPVNFRTYIRRLFAEETAKEYKGGLSMSKDAVDVMDGFTMDWLERILDLSYDGVRKAKRRTLMLKDVKTTLKSMLHEPFDPNEDPKTRKEREEISNYKTMVADGDRALDKFAKGKEGQTAQDKADIWFPPARVRRIAKQKDIRLEKEVPVFIAAVVEGIVGTVLLVAGDFARGKRAVTLTLECVKKAKNGKCEKTQEEFTEEKVYRLKPRHIQRVSEDKDFSVLFPKGAIIPRYKRKKTAKTGAGASKSTTTSKSKKTGGKKKQWPKADWGPIADSMEEESKEEAKSNQPRRSARNKKSYESDENYYGEEYFSSWF